MAGTPDQSAPDSSGGTLPKIAYVIAIVLILAYLVAVAFAWTAVGEVAETWARRLELLSGLEALAFAAAGAVLGVTVQRPAVRAAQDQAQNSEDRAREAENRADANAEAARVGEVVLAAAEAKANKADELVENLRESNRVEQGIKTEFQELVDLATSVGTGDQGLRSSGS